MERERERRTGRTRMLLGLQLAVLAPAAALIVFSLWNLRSIHRDRAVEAAMQREFGQILQITEKRLNEKARRMVEEAQAHLPCPQDSVEEKLHDVLQRHPQFAHAFLYTAHKGLTLRSQDWRLEKNAFLEENEHFAKALTHVLEERGKDIAHELRRREQMKEERAAREGAKGEQESKGPAPGDNSKIGGGKDEKTPVEGQEAEAVETGAYFGSFMPHDKGGVTYMSYAVMLLPGCEAEPALGGVALDAGFLREKFFPRMLDGILTDEQAGKNGHAVMMLHTVRGRDVVAASRGWDGGAPEMERKFAEGVSAFPSLALAIKLRGTTIAALSAGFLRTNFLIIGAISLLLLTGSWQMYRNVSREVALARLKSDFVANVSHELRTPLSLIRLYAETLEMGRLTSPEKPQHYYRIIREESERLTALINNILDFSRIEAGRREYDFRETDLPRLVRETLNAYRYQIEQSGFTYEEQIADDLPPVQVDREAFARSLLNLINNAIKYSPGEKFLSVRLFRAGDEIALQVADHGMGIPGGEQEKIFEKFYRVGDPLVHTTRGSGLGLSLVRHIVGAHGGRVSVESAPGKGSTFTIALPLIAGAAPA